jgi:hypothetical protein
VAVQGDDRLARILGPEWQTLGYGQLEQACLLSRQRIDTLVLQRRVVAVGVEALVNRF